jgi:hypothetical protein
MENSPASFRLFVEDCSPEELKEQFSQDEISFDKSLIANVGENE